MSWLPWFACVQVAIAQQPTLRGTVLAAESGEPLGM